MFSDGYFFKLWAELCFNITPFVVGWLILIKIKGRAGMVIRRYENKKQQGLAIPPNFDANVMPVQDFL